MNGTSLSYDARIGWGIHRGQQSVDADFCDVDMVRGALFFVLIFATLASLGLLHPYSTERLAVVLCLYAAGTGFVLFLLFHPRNQWLVANRSQVSDAGAVALTFDDGPDPLDTPKLLDLLREKNVKATFFVVGKRVAQHPEIVRRAWAEGHLVASHTWSHPNLFCFLTPRGLREQIERGAASVEMACGYRSPYFRSPVGLRHPLLAAYLERAGLRFISWRVRSLDTVIGNPARLARRILGRVKAGDIILLHDRLPSGTAVMLEALPGIIDELRSRGFAFALVGPRESVAASQPSGG